MCPEIFVEHFHFQGQKGRKREYLHRALRQTSNLLELPVAAVIGKKIVAGHTLNREHTMADFDNRVGGKTMLVPVIDFLMYFISSPAGKSCRRALIAVNQVVGQTAVAYLHSERGDLVNAVPTEPKEEPKFKKEAGLPSKNWTFYVNGNKGLVNQLTDDGKHERRQKSLGKVHFVPFDIGCSDVVDKGSVWKAANAMLGRKGLRKYYTVETDQGTNENHRQFFTLEEGTTVDDLDKSQFDERCLKLCERIIRVVTAKTPADAVISSDEETQSAAPPPPKSPAKKRRRKPRLQTCTEVILPSSDSDDEWNAMVQRRPKKKKQKQVHPSRAKISQAVFPVVGIEPLTRVRPARKSRYPQRMPARESDASTAGTAPAETTPPAASGRPPQRKAYKVGILLVES
jgi:hypothetical protein